MLVKSFYENFTFTVLNSYPIDLINFQKSDYGNYSA